MAQGNKMHADEIDIDETLVSRLIAEHFPRWRGLPVEYVPSTGTDNAMYRLGDDLAVRLARVAGGVRALAKELEWLPRLAPHLPLEVPLPLAEGAPTDGFPAQWAVFRWLDGAPVDVPERLADPVRAAAALAGFVKALQGVDTAGGLPAFRNGRSIPIHSRDAEVRAALAELVALGDPTDAAACLAEWERTLAAEPFGGAPVWLHGDLHGLNLLHRDGHLAAVIDFGTLAVGDPSVELITAWNLFGGPARAAYRDALGADAATWQRGRGWALSIALVAIPYYVRTNPRIVADSRRVIDELLADPC